MTMTTPWSAAAREGTPLPEYPRPQLVREGWSNLNGTWQCAFTSFPSPDPLDVADPEHPPTFDREILVPFSPELPLSGAFRTLAEDEVLWYRREFTAPAGVGGRVLLHFGAVDQSCRVAINGVEIGGNTGGFLPFTLDITDALGDRETHEIVVAVRDVTDRSWLSRGKQSSKPGGIWYTPQSGIWQTVWLERVPAVAIDRLILTPVLASREVEVTVVSHAAADGTMVAVEILAHGERHRFAEIEPNIPTRVRLDEPVRTWTPEDPFLYDVTVSLGEDRVTSYVGMRSFGIGKSPVGHACLTLNGSPYLPVGLLDQGYWPDGGLTAPSDEALIFDIELAKRMGFTMLRKHIKIEPLRWYYHCDRLGMLVWQDHVNGGEQYRAPIVTMPAIVSPTISDRAYGLFARSDEAGRAMSEAELVDMIEHLRSVTSISMWVPFNEGWGQFDAARIAEVVKAVDPTRGVDHASGWHDQGAGDLVSKHIYFRPVKIRRAWKRDDRVIALTEYGGYSHAIKRHTWGAKPMGYKKVTSAGDLLNGFMRLHVEEIAPAIADGLAATVYTQLSDVENEVNGMVTYDREVVKFDESAVRAINDQLRRVFAGKSNSTPGKDRDDDSA